MIHPSSPSQMQPDGVPSRKLPVSSSRQRASGLALWILLSVGLLLMLWAAGALGAEQTAARVDRFSSPLGAGAVVRIENVSGDVIAVPGPAFTAVVTTSASAPTREQAEAALERVRIVGNREGNAFSVVARWPDSRRSPDGRRRWISSRCAQCKVHSRFELVIPPGVAAELETVNGAIRVRDLDGELRLGNVNGDLEIRGARRSVTARTVNGKVDAGAAVFPAGAFWQLRTVNGSVLVTLPREAQFDLTGSTLGGAIVSTFPLSPAADSPQPLLLDRPRKGDRERSARARERVVLLPAEEGENLLVDPERLAQEIEASLGNFELEGAESARKGEKTVRRMRIPIPGRNYSGRLGGGGARIAASTLNGNIAILKAGTLESDARPLVSARRSIVVTVPRFQVRVPDGREAAPRVVVAPHPDPEGDPDDEDSLVRGDVSGDFLSTGGGGYRVGRVSGRVKILTRAGEIHVAAAGKGADVKTYGGDIVLGPVSGDLRAVTLAGDVRVDSVDGSLRVETSGGDIRIERVTGSVEAKTGGGDIRLPAVAGAVLAETGGGEVRLGILSRRVREVSIRNAGGDVTLVLPSNFEGEFDLEIQDADPDGARIRSDFADLAITRTPELERAAGSVNGGGSRVVVRTASGSIRIRRGPPAAP